MATERLLQRARAKPDNRKQKRTQSTDIINRETIFRFKSNTKWITDNRRERHFYSDRKTKQRQHRIQWEREEKKIISKSFWHENRKCTSVCFGIVNCVLNYFFFSFFSYSFMNKWSIRWRRRRRKRLCYNKLNFLRWRVMCDCVAYENAICFGVKKKRKNLI